MPFQVEIDHHFASNIVQDGEFLYSHVFAADENIAFLLYTAQEQTIRTWRTLLDAFSLIRVMHIEQHSLQVLGCTSLAPLCTTSGIAGRFCTSLLFFNFGTSSGIAGRFGTSLVRLCSSLVAFNFGLRSSLVTFNFGISSGIAGRLCSSSGF